MESILLIKDILKPNSFLTKIELKDAFYSIPSPKNQENTFSLFTATNSTNFVSYYSEFPHKRHIFHHLSRRSTHCCMNVHRLFESYKTSNFSSGVPVFSNQLGKICNNPKPKTRILGLHNRYNLYDSCPQSRKNSVNTIFRPKASSNKRYHLNKTVFKIHRPLHFNKTWCLPGTSALPITSVPRKLCFKGSPILPPPQSVQFRGSPEPRNPNGPTVVGRPPAVSQQNTNSYKRPITSDASDLGWGAWCGKKSVQGLWSQEEIFWHINPRELLFKLQIWL